MIREGLENALTRSGISTYGFVEQLDPPQSPSIPRFGSGFGSRRRRPNFIETTEQRVRRQHKYGFIRALVRSSQAKHEPA
jgi:hypothetical protein